MDMIGTEPTEQQQVISRWIRIIGSAFIGAGAGLGLVICLVINLTAPRRTSGCIASSAPHPMGALIILAAVGVIVALLAFARTTNSALIGSLLLGALALTIPDDFLSLYAFLLAVAILLVAVTAKCVAEFDLLRPTKPADAEQGSATPADD